MFNSDPTIRFPLTGSWWSAQTSTLSYPIISRQYSVMCENILAGRTFANHWSVTLPVWISCSYLNKRTMSPISITLTLMWHLKRECSKSKVFYAFLQWHQAKSYMQSVWRSFLIMNKIFQMLQNSEGVTQTDHTHGSCFYHEKTGKQNSNRSLQLNHTKIFFFLICFLLIFLC